MSQFELPYSTRSVDFIEYQAGPLFKEDIRRGFRGVVLRRDVQARLPNGQDASYSYYDRSAWVSWGALQNG